MTRKIVVFDVVELPSQENVEYLEGCYVPIVHGFIKLEVRAGENENVWYVAPDNYDYNMLNGADQVYVERHGDTMRRMRDLESMGIRYQLV